MICLNGNTSSILGIVSDKAIYFHLLPKAFKAAARLNDGWGPVRNKNFLPTVRG